MVIYTNFFNLSRNFVSIYPSNILPARFPTPTFDYTLNRARERKATRKLAIRRP